MAMAARGAPRIGRITGGWLVPGWGGNEQWWARPSPAKLAPAMTNGKSRDSINGKKNGPALRRRQPAGGFYSFPSSMRQNSRVAATAAKGGNQTKPQGISSKNANAAPRPKVGRGRARSHLIFSESVIFRRSSE